MVGLKRGIVAICEHQPEWNTMAAETIRDLKELFGEAAVDIQHIGSTAIASIRAKPILDIAVGVKCLSELGGKAEVLEESGHYQKKYNRFSGDLLYVIEGEDSVRTHQIHILEIDSEQWRNYVDFRDYMNLFPEKAKEYEALKERLARDCGDVQTVYTDGKREYMQQMLAKAKAFMKKQRESRFETMEGKGGEK